MSPPSISPERRRSERRKERAAFVSILASAGLTIGKGVAGYATGSLALISDAANSLLDVAATTMTWLAVRAAHKPADARHHYGHGKFESLSALVQTAFLFLLSGIIAVEGVRRLSSGQTEIFLSWPAVAVVVGSMFVDGWRWWGLARVARETGSEALAADALHFSSDLVNSACVLVAFAAAHLGYPRADALIAIGVSFFIAIAGFRLARRTIDTLLDTAPKGLAERVTGLAEKVPGVVGVERVRVRSSGSQIMGEVGIFVSRTLPLDRVTQIKERVLGAIRTDLPDSEFTISTTPVQIDDETILERVMLTAARLRVPVHHVTVQNLANRLSVSFDIEVDARLTLAQAHEVASRLEAALVEELGPQVEVESHIEPLVVQHLEGREADAETVAGIALSLANHARECNGITGVHSVRVRETPAGHVVNYHCRLDPGLDIATVHDMVDELDRRMRIDHPEIGRIVGHAEPRPQDTAGRDIAAGGSSSYR